MKRKYKRRSYGRTLAMMIMFFTGIVAAVACTRYDTLQDRLLSQQDTERLRALSELTERTERICTHLLELHCPVTAEREETLRLLLAQDAALARQNVAALPLEEASSRSLLTFFSACGDLRAGCDLSDYIRYGETVLMQMEQSLAMSRETRRVPSLAEFPDFGQAREAGLTSYDPEKDSITPHEAQKQALQYLGSSLSLRRAQTEKDCKYFRFYCRNGFCDIRRSDGALLRMAVYKKKIREACSDDTLQAALLTFWKRQNLNEPLADRTALCDGILLGSYYADGVTVHTGISAGTARISSFDRISLPRSDSFLSAQEIADRLPLPGRTEDIKLRCLPSGKAVYYVSFRAEPLGGVAQIDAQAGSIDRIRFTHQNQTPTQPDPLPAQ